MALQLNHRLSFDFDIFSPKPIPTNLLRRLSEEFAPEAVKPLVDSRDELTADIDGIKVTFLYFPFKPLFPAIQTQSLPIFAVKDLAADKAYVIGRRGTWRDYYDLAFLFNLPATSLLELIALAKRKFGAVFSPRLFLNQLTYYGDIADFTISPTAAPVLSNKTVRKILTQEVADFTPTLETGH